MVSGRGHKDIFAADMVWSEGNSPGISYARIPFDENDTSAPLVIMSDFAPGATVAPHTHGTNYFEYIIAGEQTVGKVTFGKGDVRVVTAGTGYGPIVVGPNGCSVLIVFQEARGAMTQPLGTAKAIA